MTLSKQQEWLIDNSVNVLEWPSQSLGLNAIKYFWRNLKMSASPHPSWQSLRGEEVRWRMADNCQMQMCKACHIIPKKTWGCKGASTKYWVKGTNTYAMYLFQCFIFNKCERLSQISFLLCHYGVWSVNWCGEKSNLKQFNIRLQQQNVEKNKGVWIILQGTIYIYIYIYICICIYIYIYICMYVYMYMYTGAGHIIRISSKNWFISLIPFKKWNLYNVYIHSTQTDIFQVFISFNFDDYKWQLMKTPNSVSQKIRILWKGSILKTPGATL